MPEIMHSGDLTPFQLIADASAGAVQVVQEVVKDEPIVSEAIQPVEKLLPYVLVGGSFAQEENAKKLHHDLLEKGHRSELYLLGFKRLGKQTIIIQKDYMKAAEERPFL
jgi:hypothetical protein